MGDSQQTNAKAQILNDRTYQEVEYLKKNLGPILVAALAEICIRRPADPIEYLGHWLLRWRYNEELKRRDVQNALEVVRQKAWTKDDESIVPNPAAPDQPPSPQTFTQGFVPGAPYAAPGFGGPLDPNAVEQLAPVDETTAAQPAETSGEEAPPDESQAVEKIPSGGAAEAAGEAAPEEKRTSLEAGNKTSGDKRLSQAGAAGSGEVKRASIEQTEVKKSSMAKSFSGDAAPEADEKRRSSETRRDSKNPENSNVAAEEVPPPQ